METGLIPASGAMETLSLSENESIGGEGHTCQHTEIPGGQQTSGKKKRRKRKKKGKRQEVGSSASATTSVEDLDGPIEDEELLTEPLQAANLRESNGNAEPQSGKGPSTNEGADRIRRESSKRSAQPSAVPLDENPNFVRVSTFECYHFGCPYRGRRSRPPGIETHRCRQCRTVKYCSEACMRQDWAHHEEFCKPYEQSEEVKKACKQASRQLDLFLDTLCKSNGERIYNVANWHLMTRGEGGAVVIMFDSVTNVKKATEWMARKGPQYKARRDFLPPLHLHYPSPALDAFLEKDNNLRSLFLEHDMPGLVRLVYMTESDVKEKVENGIGKFSQEELREVEGSLLRSIQSYDDSSETVLYAHCEVTGVCGENGQPVYWSTVKRFKDPYN